MKQINSVLAFLTSLLLMNGCAEKLRPGSENPYEPVMLHTVGGTVEDVKTTLDGLSMKWCSGDQIAVAADPVVDAAPYSITLKTFTLQSGEGTSKAVFHSEEGVSGTKFYAGYPASACSVVAGERYLRYNFPYEQTYVENGVMDGYIPMFAYMTEDPSSLSFMYGSGILRLNLYDAVSVSPVKITKIEVTTDVPASGLIVASLNLNRFPAYRMSSNKQTTITYTVPSVELSTDPQNPTQFNICMAATVSNGSNLTTGGVYSEMKIVFYADDGSSFTKVKSDQKIEGGVIHKMPALQYSKDQISYQVGDYYPDPEVNMESPEEVAKIEGIVISVSEDGYHGKIVSLVEGSSLQWSLSGTVDQTNDFDDGSVNAATIKALEDANTASIQYPAFEWAAKLGEGWYIPALNELLDVRALYGDLNAVKTAVNEKFTNAGGTALSDSYYYSSTEYDVLTSEGASQRNRCYAVNFKRATTASDLVFGAIKKSSNSTGCVFRAVKKF